jgi:hypothetical protein
MWLWVADHFFFFFFFFSCRVFSPCFLAIHSPCWVSVPASMELSLWWWLFIVSLLVCVLTATVALVCGLWNIRSDTGSADAVAIPHCIREDSNDYFTSLFRWGGVASVIMMGLVTGVYLFHQSFPSTTIHYGQAAGSVVACMFVGLLHSYGSGMLAFRYALRLAPRCAAAMGRSENEATMLALSGGAVISTMSTASATTLLAVASAVLVGVASSSQTHVFLPLIGFPFGSALVRAFVPAVLHHVLTRACDLVGRVLSSDRQRNLHECSVVAPAQDLGRSGQPALGPVVWRRVAALSVHLRGITAGSPAARHVWRGV